MQEDNVYSFIFEDIRRRLDDPSTIYTLQERKPEFDPIPSDIPSIDEMLCGGLPEGRIIEIFGPEASGKTTLMLHFIEAAQRRGYVVYFIDAEQSLDLAYAKRIGVDPSKLLFSQPDYGEQALETARAICESTIEARAKFGKVIRSLIVIDSIPALVPKSTFETYEKDGYDASVALGSAARMLSQLLPPLVNKAGKAGVTVVLINQERDKIGVIYGSPTTTPGGRAVKFFSSLRLKVQKIGYYEEGGEKVGIKANVIPIKSKLFPIFGKVAQIIIGNDGIDRVASLIELSVTKGIAKKSGAWFTILGRRVQGFNGLRELIIGDPEFRKQVENQLSGSHAKDIKLVEVPEKKPDATSVQDKDVVIEKPSGLNTVKGAIFNQPKFVGRKSINENPSDG